MKKKLLLIFAVAMSVQLAAFSQSADFYGVVSLGSVQVANNRCIVIVNTVEKPEDIDKKRAQEAYDFAMEHLQQKQSIKEFKKSQAGLARALTRLKAASKYSGLK